MNIILLASFAQYIIRANKIELNQEQYLTLDSFKYYKIYINFEIQIKSQSFLNLKYLMNCLTKHLP